MQLTIQIAFNYWDLVLQRQPQLQQRLTITKNRYYLHSLNQINVNESYLNFIIPFISATTTVGCSAFIAFTTRITIANVAATRITITATIAAIIAGTILITNEGYYLLNIIAAIKVLAT